MSIIIDPEFKSLIPPLSVEEYNGLQASIVAEGCRDALVTWNGILLDGHNREEICRVHGIKYRTEPVKGGLPDRLAAKIWIRANQANRRNLSDDARAMNAMELAELWGEQAKQERAAKGTPAREAKKKGITLQTTSVCKVKPAPTSRTKAAKVARVSERKMRKAKSVKEKAPDLAAKVAVDQMSLRAAEKEIGKREKAAAQAAIPADLPALTERYEVIHADLAAASVVVESVDWIITDPPYKKEFLPVYLKLADFAERVLKPGGSLLAMIGHSYLPEILSALNNTLTYHWTLAYLTPGGKAVQCWDRKVITFWKPLLWFVKGAYTGDWIGDVCRSDVNDNDKDHHQWGQSESGMTDIIKRLTLPGQLICDPFCGGGTTGVVAVKMNRRFIGIDIDAESIQTTKNRLSKVVPDVA